MSDIVERLRAYARDLGGWHYIDETCENAADELDRLNAENVRLREALIATNFSLEQFCVAFDVDPKETFIRVENSNTGEVLSKESLADIFAQARAALAEKEEK